MIPNTLLGIAEVSAGFIGFSAVATIFCREKSGLNNFLFQGIVLICLINIWGCFVPFWTYSHFEGQST